MMMRALAVVVTAGLAIACSGDDGSGSSGVGTDSGTTGETASESTGSTGAATDGGSGASGSGSSGSTGGAVDPNCPTDPLGPGLHNLTLMHDGIDRVYDLYIPASHTGTQPSPLVLNLHPLSLGGILHNVWTTNSGMNAKAEEAGFIVVQPDGTGSTASWNAGADCCAPANESGVDDVGFIKAVAADAATKACIDEKRIYSMGMSNGAFMSHRLACEEPGFVAAIGPVVGWLSPELECQMTRAVPVMQITGSEDNLASNTAAFESWRDMNGCTDAPEQTYAKGAATCMTHDECDDGVEVTHCVIEGGGHCFFTNLQAQVPDCMPTQDIHSPDALWDFMSRWSLP